MTLQQLKYVIAIAEKGSINEAAKGRADEHPRAKPRYRHGR